MNSVLISGAGIAGPALAYWLLQHGFQPTLVERAPRPRTGGYVIDFWGIGYDLVEKMGLLPAVLQAGYQLREVRVVDARGRRISSLDAELFRAATVGRYTSISRGALAGILFAAIEQRAEVLFGDTVAALTQRADGVDVEFEHAPARRFDLVVGADGLHSTVRQLTFGSEQQFEKFLGYNVAVFEAQGYRPRDEDIYVAYARPGRQIARFTLREDRTTFLLINADRDAPVDGRDTRAVRRYLRERFGGAGWECDQILQRLSDTEEVYFDRVSQIRLPHWWKGRVALVGDAAYGPSLLAGQGAALAIIGAYVLAGELARSGDSERAFARYESTLYGFMRRKQAGAEGVGAAFAPRTRLGVLLRNQLMKGLALTGVAKLALRSSLLDRIQLPDYERSRSLDADRAAAVARERAPHAAEHGK
jgi:2-polyprenyl-6-methoxyphenol hydroxylase-like FAD-dependent oxidoreductase